MLGITSTALICLMFTWPSSQYPMPTETTTKFRTAEDCLEIDLQEVEELRSHILDNVSSDYFGLKEDDWIRLKALQDQLPSNSPLKDKLVHIFRILLAAIEIANKDQIATETSRDNIIYKQADESVYPLSSDNRKMIILSANYSKEESELKTRKENSTVTKDDSSSEPSSFIKLNGMSTKSFTDMSGDDNLLMNNTGITLLDMEITTESTASYIKDVILTAYKPTVFPSMIDAKNTMSKEQGNSTNIMSKNDLKLTITEEGKSLVMTNFGYNDSFLLETKSTVKTISNNVTEEHFTDYITTKTPNPSELNKLQFENNDLPTKIGQINLPENSSIYHTVTQHILNLPHKSEHFTVNSEANDFMRNITTNISIMREGTEYQTTPEFIKLDENISDYTFITTSYTTLPVDNSLLITSANDSVKVANEEMDGSDNWQTYTTPLTTMIPYEIDKQGYTSSEDNIMSLQSLLENNTVKPKELDKHQSFTNVTNNKEMKAAYNHTNTVVVTPTVNDIFHKDKAGIESGLYFTESLDTSGKHTPARSDGSRFLDGSESTQDNVIDFITRRTDRIFTTISDKLFTEAPISSVTETDISTITEGYSDSEEVKVITNFNTKKTYEDPILNNSQINKNPKIFNINEIFNRFTSKTSTTPMFEDVDEFTFITFSNNSTMGNDEINIYGNNESQIVNVSELYDTSSTVGDTKPFVSQDTSSVSVYNQSSHIQMDGFQNEYTVTSGSLVSYNSVATEVHTTEATTSDNILLTENESYNFQDIVSSTVMYNPQSSSNSNKMFSIPDTTEEKPAKPEYSTDTYRKPNNMSHVGDESLATSYSLFTDTTTETQGDISGYNRVNNNFSSLADVSKESSKASVSNIQVNTQNNDLPDIREHTEVVTVTEPYSEVTVKLITGMSLTSHKEAGLIRNDSTESTTATGTYTENDMGNLTSQNFLFNNITRLNTQEELVQSVTRNVGEGSEAQRITTGEAETTTESIFIQMPTDASKLNVSETSIEYVVKTESDIITSTSIENESVKYTTILLPEYSTTEEMTSPVPAFDTTSTEGITTMTNISYEFAETTSNKSSFGSYNSESVTPYDFTDMDSYFKPFSSGVEDTIHISPQPVTSELVETTVTQTPEADCEGIPLNMSCDPQGTEETSTTYVSDQDSSGVTQPSTVDFIQKNSSVESKPNHFFIMLPQPIDWNDSKTIHIYNMSSLPPGNLLKSDANTSTKKCISSSPCLKVQHNEFIPRNVRPAVNEVNYSFSSNSQQKSQSNKNELMWWYKMRKLRKKPHSGYTLLRYFNKK